MSFAKPKPKSQTELEKEREEKERQAENDFEMGLFEKYDYPAFLEDVAGDSDWMIESHVLQVLNWLFYHGWDSRHAPFHKYEFRGHVPIETAHKLFQLLELKIVDLSTVRRGFEDIHRRHKLDVSGAPDKE